MIARGVPLDSLTLLCILGALILYAVGYWLYDLGRHHGRAEILREARRSQMWRSGSLVMGEEGEPLQAIPPRREGPRGR